jgi:uncharacterized protein YdhG (YjbR/CyaY superfamily)
MAITNTDRTSYFPIIEKRYGEKMSHWHLVMKKLEDKKYPEQVAHLKENYGFSQAHANALVMYSRGSKSAARFSSPADYYKSLDPKQAKLVKAIFAAIKKKHPNLTLVIAWNQPMLKSGDRYVFGVSTAKNHILIAPWSAKVLKKFTPHFKEYRVNKKTIALPNDWKVDAKLLCDMVTAGVKEKSI